MGKWRGGGWGIGNGVIRVVKDCGNERLGAWKWMRERFGV